MKIDTLFRKGEVVILGVDSYTFLKDVCFGDATEASQLLINNQPAKAGDLIPDDIIDEAYRRVEARRKKYEMISRSHFWGRQRR